MKNIIVIGGNAAGPAAAAKAKRVSPSANVMLFESSEFISTGTCELPYLLSGIIDDYRKIVFFDERSFEAEKGVKVFSHHFVENIDRTNKRISVRNLANGELLDFPYDKIVLATGSKAKKLPQLASNLKNVFTLKSVPDYLKILEFINSNKVRTVGIIGAGYIGLEAAEAFARRGFEVYVWDSEKYPLPSAEKEIRILVSERLKSKKVYFAGEARTEFGFENSKVVYVKNGSELIEIDLLLIAIGVSPNVELAQSAGLKLGSSGGIVVNNKLQTSDVNIYAAGDNVEVKNYFTNSGELLPIATLARRFGHIAGGNAAGRNDFISTVVRNIGVKIFDDFYFCAGATLDEAKASNKAVDSVTAVAKNLVHVMPESRNVFGKLVFEKRTGRILGASFLGGKETSGYADFICGMIKMKACVQDISEVYFNYTPPASPFINLLPILSKKALRKI